jgi:hypothetical protein
VPQRLFNAETALWRFGQLMEGADRSDGAAPEAGRSD